MQNRKEDVIKSQTISLGFFICVVRDSDAIGVDRRNDAINFHSIPPG
ncbi:MAG TPA: hypothetical protein VG028_18465 [Terriglobia bacterium]|nr:hypothetical protein [Terriglobia bacterium]